MGSPLSLIPQRARALTAIGDQTAQAVHDLFHAPQESLFPPEDNPGYLDLAEALRKRRWSDEQAAILITALGRMIFGGRVVDVKAVTRWVLAHPDSVAADAVIDCMEVEPPDEIDIIKVLSRKGSQKLVFLASWRLRQQEVVLKRVLGNPESVGKVLARELQPHPLSMVHPNIIETHFLRNGGGEVFLVERRLPIVLSDDWDAGGVHEAANLLFDIAKALRFLHDGQRVHGDVKPDNIGRRGDHYVLLDFGICRLRDEFTRVSAPTGSLRTRAPELLAGDGYLVPEKVDVWALGATVFNALTARFPLTKAGEDIPRISSPAERDGFERALCARAATEWDQYVSLSDVPPPLKSILEGALQKDVTMRLSASELVQRAEKELSAYLRSAQTLSASGHFSPLEEFRQIRAFLTEHSSHLLPEHRRQHLAIRLVDLRTMPGFDDETRRQIDNLITMVG